MTEQRSKSGRQTGSGANGRTSKPSPVALARRACAELAELLEREPEGVISLEPTDDGWQVGIEVVETRRIPDTADIIAEYEVTVDGRGRLSNYRRVRRYTRGSVQEHG